MAEADYYCGGGGGLRVTNLEMSKRILKRRISLVRDLDIDAMTTCCPFCIKQLKIGLSQEHLPHIKVHHLAIVMAQAMGLGQIL